MIQIVFCLKAVGSINDKFGVVGSLPQLGNWDPFKALFLQMKNDKWCGSLLNLQVNTKFEFKIIKIQSDSTIIWQQMPNNSNRKFRPKCSGQLHIQWSCPQGKLTALKPAQKTLPDKNKPTVLKRLQSQFNPYKKANDNDSGDSDEQQFLIVRRKMSDQLNINKIDLEQMYYKSSSLQIFCSLLKKKKIYVLSEFIDLNLNIPYVLENQLNKLPMNYMAKWINQDCFKNNQICLFYPELQKKNSLFQIRSEEIHLSALYSKTSYFFILDTKTAIQMKDYLQKVNCVLIVPANQYQNVVKNLDNLIHVDIICFDMFQTTSKLPLLEKNGKKIFPNQINSENCKQVLQLVFKFESIQFIIQKLKDIKQKYALLIEDLPLFSPSCISNLLQQNSICILDQKLINDKKIQIYDFLESKHNSSVVVIIAQNQLNQTLLSLKSYKNLVLIFHHFQKIILDNQQYHPLSNFRQSLQLLKLQAKIYLQKYKGQIQQFQNSIIYWLPEQQQTASIKIQNECKSVTRNYPFVKVSRKGCKIKISWNLSKEARMIRTICEIKNTNYGQLNNFNLVGSLSRVRDLKQIINILIQHKSKLFISPSTTEIKSYVYDSN